jgi:hypothetical protein
MHRTIHHACVCGDCEQLLMVRSFLGGYDHEWFYLKNRVWRAATVGSPSKRFLCVRCTERRLDRKLTADDFRRNAAVNSEGPSLGSYGIGCADWFHPNTWLRLNSRCKAPLKGNQHVYSFIRTVGRAGSD